MDTPNNRRNRKRADPPSGKGRPLAAPRVELRDAIESSGSVQRPLLAPLRYLRIRTSEKHFYDMWLPGLIAVGIWVLTLAVPPSLDYFGPDGLMAAVKDLLVMAVPFLIGSLAAVAMGSPGEHMDRRSVGELIALDGKALSLRQFVCYLLGYLCFLSLVTLVLIIAALWLKPVVDLWTHDYQTVRDLIGYAASLILFLLLSSLTVTFLWALYFLTDVVNRK